MAIKITTLFEDASKQTALAPRTKVSAVSNENGVGLSELLNGKVSTAYAICSTAAATAAKVVTIEGNTNWSLVTGTVIYVKFTETNTAENPTINVNSTGAKSVVLNGTTITTSSLSYAGYANRIISYIYNGTQWAFNGWSYDGNTDTKVQQNAVITTAKEYPVLLGYSDSTAKVTNAVNKAAGFTYNPNTKILTAPTFKGTLDGNASSATTLTGLTATIAELNKMDGVTATTTELNYVDGVTSNIQTQLNNKMSSHPTCIELGGSADSVVNEGFIDFHFNNSSSDYTSRIIESASGALEVNSVKFSGGKVTSGTWNGSTIGLAYGGTGATTAAGALTNLGLTATATELNYCDGVTSNIQTQLNGKSATSHNHDSTYVNVGGDTMTGNLTINLAGARTIYNNGTRSMWIGYNSNGGLWGIYDVTKEAYLISSDGTTVTLNGMSKTVRDATNGTATTINYGAAGLTTTNWFAAWNGYELRAISPTVSKTVMGAATSFVQTSQPTANAKGDIWFVI